jgi:3',5'-cyclic-AMP phosphodiesterase
LTRQRTSGRATELDFVSILQITDLHLLPDAGSRLLGVDTAASLDAVLRAALAEHTADALLVTGDIAHEPTSATYARARGLIEERYRGRALWLSGNHDLGAPLTRALANEGRDADLLTDLLELGDWSIIAIDTHVDGAEGGYVAPAELARLRERLTRSDARFVIVVGHHPPLPIGTPWLDKGCIRNGAELLELLGDDARVKAYVCGHVHQETASTYRGLRLLTTPSTCFQFVAQTERFAVDATPPGWRWLELAADGTLTTRVGRAMDFAVTLDVSKFKH